MKTSTLSRMLLFAALIVIFFAGCSRTPEQRAQRMVDHMASELKLNDAQKLRLEKIKNEFLARRPLMTRERETTIKEANELMRSADIDKAKLDALVARSRSQADELIGFIGEKFTEIHDLLTPEQREQLVAHIEKYTRHAEGRGGTVSGSAAGGGL